MDSLKNLLDDYLGKKAPALPAKAKEVLVKFAPWITIIILITTIPVILAYLGISTLIMPFAKLYGGSSLVITLSVILAGAAAVINILALPGLFKRTVSGWNMVYYGNLVSTISSLVTGNVIGTIVSFIISMYIIFQVRSYYH